MKDELNTVESLRGKSMSEFLDDFKYQKELTKKLDHHDGEFDQSLLNEILLWKVNRYALADDKCIALMNQISRTATELDKDTTKEALLSLLETKGIRLPVASTVLRFRNPEIYQILDQRVYRFLYGSPMKIPTNTESQIDYYLQYLDDLRLKCSEFEVPFNMSDRILYQADKDMNKSFKIKY